MILNDDFNPMIGDMDDDDNEHGGVTDAQGWASQGESRHETSQSILEPLKHINGADLAMVMSSKNEESLLAYFDQTLKKTWAGPEHWRIQKFKDESKAAVSEPKKARKEKESFEIDFFAPDGPDAATLFQSGQSSITLSKSQWKSASRNLLPDDVHFNSQQLLRLFLKPKVRYWQKARSQAQNNEPEVNAYDMDENFWAKANEARVKENLGTNPVI
jgi:hypothetical protein